MVDSTIYVFGGFVGFSGENCSGNPPAPSNDLYKLTWSWGELNWSKVDIKGDEIPLARYRHSACEVEGKLVVCGGYLDAKTRTNDVWEFDPKTRSWQQLSADIPKDGAATAPAPRGSHTASVVGNKMYIFGGYGGYGFAQREMSDLFVFDVPTRLWTLINVKNGPQARSGHTACVVKDRICIYGGHNSKERFSDIFWFNTSRQDWVESEIAANMSASNRRWNHAAVALKGHFNYKMMVIGGSSESKLSNSKRGRYNSDVFTFDVTEHGIWSKLQISGKAPPLGRSKHAVVLDEKESRIIVFGGWADDWLGDLYVLKYGNAMDKEQVAGRMLLNDKDRSTLNSYFKRFEKDGYLDFKLAQEYLLTGKGKKVSPVFKWSFLTPELVQLATEKHVVFTSDRPVAALNNDEFLALFETLKIFDNIDTQKTGGIAFDSYAEFIFSGTLFKWSFETETYEDFMQTLSRSDKTGEGRVTLQSYLRQMHVLRVLQSIDAEFTGKLTFESIKQMLTSVDSLSSAEFEAIAALVRDQATDNVEVGVWNIIRDIKLAGDSSPSSADAQENDQADEAKESTETDAKEDDGSAAEATETKAENGEAKDEEGETKEDQPSEEGEATKDKPAEDAENPSEAATEKEKEKEPDTAIVSELRAIYVKTLEERQRRQEVFEDAQKQDQAASKVQAHIRGRQARNKAIKDAEESANAPAEAESEAEDTADAQADTTTGDSKIAPEEVDGADAETKTEAEGESEPAGETQATAETDSKTDADAEAKTETDPEAKGESEGTPDADSKPENEPQPEPEAKAEGEVEAKPEAEAKSEPKAEAEAEAEAKPEAEAEAKPEAEAEAKPEAEAEAEAEAKPEAEADSKAEAAKEGEATTEPKGDAETEAKPEAEPEAAAEQEEAKPAESES